MGRRRLHTICYAGVALVPGIRPAFMRWALHTDVDLGSNVMTLATFATGVVIWEAVGLLGVALFAALYNRTS